MLAANEPGWLGLLERARMVGPPPGLADLDDAALVEELGRRSSRMASAMCTYLELVAELTVRGVWGDHGARTPAAWLSFELGLGAPTAAVLRRLACEAGMVLVATDGPLPIDVGRLRRPTAAQRRALQARDRSCRFPGCGARRHLHAHHVVHWADGGPTDVASLVLVCGFHHRFVHERQWQVTAAGGTFWFAPPSGPPLPDTGRLPGIAAASSAEDVVPDWLGADPAPTRPRDWFPDAAHLEVAVSVLHQELRAVLRPPLAATG